MPSDMAGMYCLECEGKSSMKTNSTHLIEATNVALALTCHDLIVSNPVAVLVARAIDRDPSIDVSAVDSAVLLDATIALKAAITLTAGAGACTEALEAARARLSSSKAL